MVGLLVLFAVGIIIIVTGRPATSPPTSLPSVPPSHLREPVTWVLAQSSLSNILSADPSIAAKAFDHPYVYITATPGSSEPALPGWRTVPTVNFKSYAAFSGAVSAGTMPSWTKAVLYDPEAWSLTPVNEQANVKYYMQRFCLLAHSHGWQAIMTPATDLMNNYPKLPGETNMRAFIRNNIAGAAARYADLLEAQSQAIETSPGAYTWFLTRARSQALAANPRVVFLGGLTSSHLGTTASAEVMYHAALSVSDVVDGFFLNVSRNPPDPMNAAQFLHQLAAGRQLADVGTTTAQIVITEVSKTTQITQKPRGFYSIADRIREDARTGDRSVVSWGQAQEARVPAGAG
jgi:hypothetical protein